MVISGMEDKDERAWRSSEKLEVVIIIRLRGYFDLEARGTRKIQLRLWIVEIGRLQAM